MNLTNLSCTFCKSTQTTTFSIIKGRTCTTCFDCKLRIIVENMTFDDNDLSVKEWDAILFYVKTLKKVKFEEDNPFDLPHTSNSLNL